MGTKEDQYKQSFGLGQPPSRKKINAALKHALDIRKFEIGLYWQRAAYFWALIAAAFAGYFAVLAAQYMPANDKDFNAFVIACLGLIFSLSWFLVNRGSKYWQENWENHVDMLEDDITGPLYKTILYRPPNKNLLPRLIEGSAPFSVSQINQWVSLFTLAIWLCLILDVLPPFDLEARLSARYCTVSIATVVATLLLVLRTKSNIDKGHKHSMSVKRTSVIDE
ncbi:MAG: hypothetical protein ACREX1_01400 [Advenella sp.]